MKKKILGLLALIGTAQIAANARNYARAAPSPAQTVNSTEGMIRAIARKTKKMEDE